MRLVSAALAFFSIALFAQDSATRARQLEAEGDIQGAIRLLQDAAASNPADLWAYAELLDRRNSPQAREAFQKVRETVNIAGGKKVDFEVQVKDGKTILKPVVKG